MILGKLFSTAVVAVYSVGAQIYMMYMQFGTQIASVFYPKVSILYQEENGNQKVSDLFVRVGRVTFMIIMLILSGFIVFGKEFLLIWVGEGYTEAYYVAIVVMIPFSVDLAQNLALAILQVKKQYGFRAKNLSVKCDDQCCYYCDTYFVFRYHRCCNLDGTVDVHYKWTDYELVLPEKSKS